MTSIPRSISMAIIIPLKLLMLPSVPSKCPENITASYIWPLEEAGKLENQKKGHYNKWKELQIKEGKRRLEEAMSNVDILLHFKPPLVDNPFRNGLWKIQGKNVWMAENGSSIFKFNTQCSKFGVHAYFINTWVIQAISNANFKTFYILLMRYLKNTWISQ